MRDRVRLARECARSNGDLWASSTYKSPLEADRFHPGTPNQPNAAGTRTRARREGYSSSESESESELDSESDLPLPLSAPAPPERLMTIRSGSTVTSTARWPAQCSP